MKRVTQWFIKPGVSSGEQQNRLRQHGTPFILFSKNSLCEFFEKRSGFFHPAAGESGRLSRQTPGLEPTA
jgi:hypothetical protein